MSKTLEQMVEEAYKWAAATKLARLKGKICEHGHLTGACYTCKSPDQARARAKKAAKSKGAAA